MTITRIGGPEAGFDPNPRRLDMQQFLRDRVETLKTERDTFQATMQRQGEQLRQLREATEKLGDNLREVLDRVSEALCDNEPAYANGFVDGSANGLLFYLGQLEAVLGIDPVGEVAGDG